MNSLSLKSNSSNPPSAGPQFSSSSSPDKGGEAPKVTQAPKDTEVREKATRRRFSAAYKVQILEKTDACTKPGEVGALLRREGLYASHLAIWREARRQGALEQLRPKKRGPKVVEADPRDKKIVELEHELRKTQSRAERAEALVELQKKVSQLLGIALPGPDERKP